jgi:2-dehydropantoate 2-reductase
MDLPIYIVGAGAIGLALATCLRQAKKDVILLHARESVGTAYSHPITMVGPDGLEHSEEVSFSFLSEFSQLNGIILLTSKSFGNTYLAEKLAGKVGQSPLVLLQNGLTVEQPFLDNDFPGVYRCVLLATSQTLSPVSVRYKPVAESSIGVIKGEISYLNELVDSINTPGFPFRAEPNIQPAIWEKAIINAVFNSVCPLLNVDNGVFHREPKAFDLAKAIIREGVQLAAEMGIVLKQNEVEGRLLQISNLSDGQLISTLVDINQHRQTELETLNLAMVRLAERLNKVHLIERIKVLGELTKLKSDLSRAGQL